MVNPSMVERAAFALRAVTAAVALAAFWVAVRALAFPLSLPQPVLAEGSAPSAVTDSTPETSLESLSSLWQRDLRQTLIEPPAPPPPPPTAPPPPPPPPKLPKLLATFEEANRAWGLFLDDAGNEQLRAVGTQIEAFEITSVNAGRARLRSGSQTFEVEVPKEEQTARRSQRRG